MSHMSPTPNASTQISDVALVSCYNAIYMHTQLHELTLVVFGDGFKRSFPKFGEGGFGRSGKLCGISIAGSGSKVGDSTFAGRFG